MKDLASRFSSRKFLLTLVALLIVTIDSELAEEVALVIAPFIGAEGLKDSLEKFKK